jgi:hypothetical protein
MAREALELPILRMQFPELLTSTSPELVSYESILVQGPLKPCSFIEADVRA